MAHRTRKACYFIHRRLASDIGADITPEYACPGLDIFLFLMASLALQRWWLVLKDIFLTSPTAFAGSPHEVWLLGSLIYIDRWNGFICLWGHYGHASQSSFRKKSRASDEFISSAFLCLSLVIFFDCIYKRYCLSQRRKQTELPPRLSAWLLVILSHKWGPRQRSMRFRTAYFALPTVMRLRFL